MGSRWDFKKKLKVAVESELRDRIRRGESPEVIKAEMQSLAQGVFTPVDGRESVSGTVAGLTNLEETRFFAQHHDESNLLRSTAQYLKGNPVNMRIDLAAIPRTGLSEEDIQEQLVQNMETVARLVAWYNTFGLDVRYILEDEDTSYRDKASAILKDRLARLGSIPGINADQLLLRIGRPHEREGVIEVSLKNLGAVERMESLPDKTYVVALKDDGSKAGFPVPNYTAAASMGLSLAALDIAKNSRAQEEDYRELKNKVLSIFRNIFKRYRVIKETDDFSPEELEMMASGAAKTRLYYAILYALPPIVKAAIERLREYHEKIHLILQSA